MERKIAWSGESSYRRAILRVWLSKWMARDTAGICKTQNFSPKASKLGSSMKSFLKTSSPSVSTECSTQRSPYYVVAVGVHCIADQKTFIYV